MTTPSSYTDALERALGGIVAKANSELLVLRERAEAISATVNARVAEGDAKLAVIETRISDRLAELKAGFDPALIELMVADALAKIPAADPGKSVTVDDVRPMLEEMVAAQPKPENGRSVTVEELRPLVLETVAVEVAKIPAADPGKDGKLPIVTLWSDHVHYEGAVVSHSGSTFQALRDTGREPPHEDWQCIARAGRDGNDGQSLKIIGTWDEKKSDYKELNVVALNGASFSARYDNPGPCPGDGWQLIASQGKRGKEGERFKGDPGVPGKPIRSINVDDDGLLTLTNGDGSSVTCDLYPLLSKLQR